MTTPSTPTEPLQVLAETIQFLDRNQIPYFVTGSMASSIQGEFRATNDVDIVAKFSASQGSKLASELAHSFFVDEIAIVNAIDERRSFNIIHKETMFKVDFFTRTDEFQKVQLERSDKVSIPGTELQVSVASAEDIILSKLVWYRKGNEISERQWKDVLGVIEMNRDAIDADYLRSWSTKLQVDDLLERALEVM